MRRKTKRKKQTKKEDLRRMRKWEVFVFRSSFLYIYIFIFMHTAKLRLWGRSCLCLPIRFHVLFVFLFLFVTILAASGECSSNWIFPNFWTVMRCYRFSTLRFYYNHYNYTTQRVNAFILFSSFFFSSISFCDVAIFLLFAYTTTVTTTHYNASTAQRVILFSPPKSPLRADCG